MTEPKEGDRVRCTLGENVIVGTVLSLDKIFTDTYLSVVFGDKRQVLIDPSVWTVEVIEPEIDNFPTTPGPYEVTWEDGTASDFNPYEVREDGLYRLSHNGSWSKWHKPDVHLRRATWKRLPAPVQLAGLDVARSVLTFLRDGGA